MLVQTAPDVQMPLLVGIHRRWTCKTMISMDSSLKGTDHNRFGWVGSCEFGEMVRNQGNSTCPPFSTLTCNSYMFIGNNMVQNRVHYKFTITISALWFRDALPVRPRGEEKARQFIIQIPDAHLVGEELHSLDILPDRGWHIKLNRYEI